MLSSNARLIVGGCAALAIGAVVGWVAPLLLTAPKAAPVQVRDRQAPAPSPNADEAPTPAQLPAPAVAPAPPAPPTRAVDTPRPRQRNAVASGPTGVWIDHTGRGAVEITECGTNLCGRIVWLKDTANSSVCGTQIIGNVRSVGGGTWDGGWIYDPEKNARYSLELKPIGTDRLRVVGYLGSKFFSETFTWKRPTTDLKRCDAPASAAVPSPARSDEKSASGAIEKTAKAEPSPPAPDNAPETRSASKNPKSGDLPVAAIEKIARELLDKRDVKGKSGRKECTLTMPYVGVITIPCPE